MTIGLYTSEHYFELKKAALDEAIKKLGIEASVASGNSFRPPWPEQAFGFSEMFTRARFCAAQALSLQKVDIGIGIENSLTLISDMNEWYYVIGISIQTKDGGHVESFTPGVRVPPWMMKEVQDDKVKMDVLTQNLVGQDDPIMYFSGGTLTRKDLMVPALLLALVNLNLDKHPAVSL
jgi:non-canonical (house-cleaning) NTP pyrophosphatase